MEGAITPVQIQLDHMSVAVGEDIFYLMVMVVRA